MPRPTACSVCYFSWRSWSLPKGSRSNDRCRISPHRAELSRSRGECPPGPSGFPRQRKNLRHARLSGQILGNGQTVSGSAGPSHESRTEGIRPRGGRLGQARIHLREPEKRKEANRAGSNAGRLGKHSASEPRRQAILTEQGSVVRMGWETKRSRIPERRRCNVCCRAQRLWKTVVCLRTYLIAGEGCAGSVASPFGRVRSTANPACVAITVKIFKSSTVNIPRFDRLST